MEVLNPKGIGIAPLQCRCSLLVLNNSLQRLFMSIQMRKSTSIKLRRLNLNKVDDSLQTKISWIDLQAVAL
jgi:hypothetical protein